LSPRKGALAREAELQASCHFASTGFEERAHRFGDNGAYDLDSERYHSNSRTFHLARRLQFPVTRQYAVSSQEKKQ
jgi:hypothetical protein